jgi:hypothetical protein
MVADIPATTLIPESDMIYTLHLGKVNLDHQVIPENATIFVRVDIFNEAGTDDFYSGLVVF